MRLPLAAGALGLGMFAPSLFAPLAIAGDGLPVLTPSVAPEAVEAAEAPPAETEAGGAPDSPAAAPLHGPIKSLRSLLDSHRGSPVLLTIWATWCGPCVKEIPLLNEAARRFQGDGLEVLGVSVDTLSSDSDEEGLAAVTRFMAEHEMSYPAFYYEGDANVLGNALGWTGVVPFSVLYDSRGKIVDRMPGAVSESRLFSRLSELLRDSPAKRPR